MQPGEIRLHSWMLYTSQAPILEQEEPTNSSKSLTDSDTSDDTEVDPRLRTSVEEREYDTIPGSAIATHIALSHSRAQANPMVENGPLH